MHTPHFPTRSSWRRQLGPKRHHPKLSSTTCFCQSQTQMVSHFKCSISSHNRHFSVSDETRVVFRSSDSEYFSLSRRDVDAHTSALVPKDWNPGSVINLTEHSSILEVLFQFIGPRIHPRLFNEDFDFLAGVARAAEKYKVFSAMNTCSERMR